MINNTKIKIFEDFLNCYIKISVFCNSSKKVKYQGIKKRIK